VDVLRFSSYCFPWQHHQSALAQLPHPTVQPAASDSLNRETERHRQVAPTPPPPPPAAAAAAAPTCHIQHTAAGVEVFAAKGVHQPGSKPLRPQLLGSRGVSVGEALTGMTAAAAGPCCDSNSNSTPPASREITASQAPSANHT